MIIYVFIIIWCFFHYACRMLWQQCFTVHAHDAIFIDPTYCTTEQRDSRLKRDMPLRGEWREGEPCEMDGVSAVDPQGTEHANTVVC